MWGEIKRVQCGKKEELLEWEDDQQYEVQQCSVENKLKVIEERNWNVLLILESLITIDYYTVGKTENQEASGEETG